MIKAVLFDYGGVLTEGGKTGGTHQAFAQLYGQKILQDTHFKDLVSRLFHGTIETEDFFAELNKQYSPSHAYGKEDFLTIADSPYSRAEQVHGLASQLRDAGIRTGVVSNVIAISAEEHNRRGDYAAFDPVLLSCDEHVAKPELAFYERAIEKLGLPASEVLFIDDRDFQLVPARQLGMHTILAESPDQIVRDSKKLLEAENGITLDS